MLAGEEAGSKLDKARQLNITVIVIDKDNVMMAPVNAQGGSMSQVINKIPQIISSMNP